MFLSPKTKTKSNRHESKELKNNIKQLRKLIDELNYEIFKNPRNYTRPPSEYLEIYNAFTEQLHYLQIKEQNTEHNDDDDNIDADTEQAPLNDIKEIFLNKESNQLTQPIKINNGKGSSASMKPQAASVDSELLLSPNFKEPKLVGRLEQPDARKPPLPKNANLPKFKLDHPKTLPTHSSGVAVSALYSSTTLQPNPTGANSMSKSNLSQTSPASTPGPINGSDASASLRARHDSSNSPPCMNGAQPVLNISSCASSPSFSIINQNMNHRSLANAGNSPAIAHNSRSFGDINDAIISTSMVNSLSPSSSIATTPTFNGSAFSSSFLRIFIGSSTAVIEKKPIPLKDALCSKLKSRNLETDKCIAFTKDTK